MTSQEIEPTVQEMKAALTGLREALESEFYMEETPIEVAMAMEKAASALELALRALGPPPQARSAPPTQARFAPPPHSLDAPTPKQGQFLAYIRAYNSPHPRRGGAHPRGVAEVLQPHRPVGELHAEDLGRVRITPIETDEGESILPAPGITVEEFLSHRLKRPAGLAPVSLEEMEAAILRGALDGDL
jgi:hypothetical protein